VSVRGVRSRTWGCFIGAARARGRASLGAGVWCRASWVCSSASSRVEHVGLCFCSCSNAYTAHIFTNLGKIAMYDLFPRLSSVICVWKSCGFGLWTGCFRVAKMPVSHGRVPRKSAPRSCQTFEKISQTSLGCVQGSLAPL
jgi:hypothetical protein